VENLRGNARIVGTAEDKVKVTGRKSIRAMSKDAADAADRQTPIELSVQGNHITVRTNQERATGEQARLDGHRDLGTPRRKRGDSGPVRRF
jgi:hypothetical protein